MKVFMAAVRHAQLDLGFEWSISASGCEPVRRTMRFLKRKYPSSGKASKLPITLSLLRRILPLLPGWPCLEALAHDDLVFAVASVVAVSAFLRGGEFLYSKKSDRPLLRMSDFVVRTVRGAVALVVQIPQTKARWWLSAVDVPIFGDPSLGPFCPHRLWNCYLKRSPLNVCERSAAKLASTPAFHTSRGVPLDRAFMLARTEKLLKLAGIPIVDPSGKPSRLLMSSWRSGAVRSAVDAGISESLIMELGRWSSVAWRYYLIHSSSDLRGAGFRMWRSSCVPSCGDRRPVVAGASRVFELLPSLL